MAKKTEGKRKIGNIYENAVVFENKLEPAVYRRYLEQVISANLQEHVPAHQQESLLKEFVKAGLMAP